MDERITTAASCGSAISVRYSNYRDYWYLGDDGLHEMYAIDISSDLHELLAIIAPRPFLLSLGKGNYLDQSWPYVNTAKEVYALYGKENYLGYFGLSRGLRAV